MNIPKSFTLANRKWTVKFTKIEASPGYMQTWGRSMSDRCLIELNEDLLAKGNEELLAHTWEHELLHALFSTHGVLDHDERLIDGVSALRRQYELTKRGEGHTSGKKKAPPGRLKEAEHDGP